MNDTAIRYQPGIMINAPSVYDQMPSEVYHADPCETPSLSAGMINRLLIAPAKCMIESSVLNPDWAEPEADGKFVIGSVAHLLFLEPAEFSARVKVMPYNDWRTNEAKAARASAYKTGLMPILDKHMLDIEAMRKVFFANDFMRAAFEGGRSEQSMFWRHPVHGFWCRARADWLADSRMHINDYKTTLDASPAEFGRHAYRMNYHRRAAWYLEGAHALFGDRPDHYWFVNQETEAPYLTSVIELDSNALEAGQRENDYAADIFARCLRTNDWYGYRHPSDPSRDRAFRVGLPNYAHMQIDQRT